MTRTGTLVVTILLAAAALMAFDGALRVGEGRTLEQRGEVVDVVVADDGSHWATWGERTVPAPADAAQVIVDPTSPTMVVTDPAEHQLSGWARLGLAAAVAGVGSAITTGSRTPRPERRRTTSPTHAPGRARGSMAARAS